MGKWALFSNPPIALIAGAVLVLLGLCLLTFYCACTRSHAEYHQVEAGLVLPQQQVLQPAQVQTAQH